MNIRTLVRKHTHTHKKSETCSELCEPICGRVARCRAALPSGVYIESETNNAKLKISIAFATAAAAAVVCTFMRGKWMLANVCVYVDFYQVQ